MVGKVCQVDSLSSFRLATSTRQSARYKDDLQTARVSASNIVKPKPKKKIRVDFPSDWTPEKEATIYNLVRQWSIDQDIIRTRERQNRIDYLEKRIKQIGESEGEMRVDSS